MKERENKQKKWLVRGGFIVLFVFLLFLIFYSALLEEKKFLKASWPGSLTPGSGSGKLQLATSANTSSVEIFPGNDTDRNVRVIVKSGSDSVRLENNGNSVFVGTETSLPFSFIASDQARLIILSNGNVGVGTSTPLRKLDILGGLKFSQDFYIGGRKKSFPFNRSVAGVISLVVPTTSLALGNILSATTGTKLDAAYSTTSVSDFTVGTANTGFSGTWERVWGENTDTIANTLYNSGTGECTKVFNGQTIKMSRSKMTAHFENGARACPKNTWVCNFAEREAATCTNASGNDANILHYNYFLGSTFVITRNTGTAGPAFISDLYFTPANYYFSKTYSSNSSFSNTSIAFTSFYNPWCCFY